MNSQDRLESVNIFFLFYIFEDTRRQTNEFNETAPLFAFSEISTRLYTSAHMVDYNFRQSAPPHERKVAQTRPVFDL